MDRLRDVFPQVSAVLQAQFPENRLWGHAVFQHGDWAGFAEHVRQSQTGKALYNTLVLLAENNVAVFAAAELATVSQSFRAKEERRGLVKDLGQPFFFFFLDMRAVRDRPRRALRTPIFKSRTV